MPIIALMQTAATEADPTLHKLSEMVPVSVVWSVLGAVLCAMAVVIWWFARRDRNALDTRCSTHDSSIKKLKEETVPELHEKINDVKTELGNFKVHVGEDYVSRSTLDRHIVEPLRRIEQKLDAHILQNGSALKKG